MGIDAIVKRSNASRSGYLFLWIVSPSNLKSWLVTSVETETYNQSSANRHLAM